MKWIDMKSFHRGQLNTSSPAAQTFRPLRKSFSNCRLRHFKLSLVGLFAHFVNSRKYSRTLAYTVFAEVDSSLVSPHQ
jgi:hypothetical protein